LASGIGEGCLAISSRSPNILESQSLMVIVELRRGVGV
jgi:hypothetical protein